jgi:hypothetical protein
MGDWKIELDALIRETSAFAKAVSYRTSRGAPFIERDGRADYIKAA